MPEKLDKSRTVKLGDGGAEKEFVSGYDTMPDVEDLEKIVDKELEKLEENPAVPSREKLMLAKKIQKRMKKLKIKIVSNRKDPDKRDYFVSNKKIEKKGFKAKTTLEQGIEELITLFEVDNKKVINNY